MGGLSMVYVGDCMIFSCERGSGIRWFLDGVCLEGLKFVMDGLTFVWDVILVVCGFEFFWKIRYT